MLSSSAWSEPSKAEEKGEKVAKKDTEKSEKAEPPPQPPPAVDPGLTPWIAIGGGAVLAGFGVMFGSFSAQAEENLETLRTQSKTKAVSKDDIDIQNEAAALNAMLANLAFAGGAVAIGVGVWMLLSQDTGDAVATPMLFEHGGGGVGVGMRF